MDEYEEIEKVGVSEANYAENERSTTNEKKRPEYRVLQPDTDNNGKRVLKNVGGMWKAETKDGREYFIMKIGELRLLVFPNTPKQ